MDVELWPWGMDRGQACKKLEISTSTDPLAEGHKCVRQKELKQVHEKHQNEQRTEKPHHSKSQLGNGHRWSLQAQQWAYRSADEPKKTDRVFMRGSNIDSCNPEPEFKLVGRCELSEETHISFTRPHFSPRPPFISPPPLQPANCRQEELWSRGLLSLGAVTQLRVTMPFGGAASALGLKALAVWGQPARCCPADEVERIKRLHEASARQLLQPVFFASSVRQTKKPLQTATPPRYAFVCCVVCLILFVLYGKYCRAFLQWGLLCSVLLCPPSNISIPEEFIDPITQEVMMLPMLLPSGVSVDSATLEEYQKREATWGRPPNDPFTGVPFTSTSQPVPNPQLKSRIDHFTLQKGVVQRDGMLGRQGRRENPQASRLIGSDVYEQTQNSPCVSKSLINDTDIKHGEGNTNMTLQIRDTGSGPSSDKGNNTSICQPKNESEGDRGKKRDLSGVSKCSTESMAENQLLPQTKRPRNDAGE